MSDQDALIEAILATPGDDAPRLIYADWLDEHGETDYAEFIRVSCEFARLTNGDKIWRPTRRRLHWAWERLRKRWDVDYPLTKLQMTYFPRGFPSKRIEVSGIALVRESSRWWPIFPVKSLRLTQWIGFAESVANCDYLQRLDLLDLTHQGFELQHAHSIVNSPYLSDLKYLWVSTWRSTNQTIDILCRRFGCRVRIWDKRCPPPS